MKTGIGGGDWIKESALGNDVNSLGCSWGDTDENFFKETKRGGRHRPKGKSDRCRKASISQHIPETTLQRPDTGVGLISEDQPCRGEAQIVLFREGTELGRGRR